MNSGGREVHLPFKPSSVPQASFIHTDAPTAAFVAGVGAGKTTALCLRAWLLSWKYPGNRGMLARYSYDELRDSFIPTLKKVIPAELMINPDVLDRKDLASQVLLLHSSDPDRPSEILLRNLEDPHKFESLEIGFFGISQANDPKVTRRMWDVLNERLRWNEVPFQFAFLEANYGGNASEGGWIWEIFKEQQQGALYEASTLDNWDNLPDDYRQRLEAMPDLRKKHSVYGSWDPLIDIKGQPVFPEFNYKFHVPEHGDPGDVRSMVNTGRPVIRGIDVPGPPACVWVQMDNRGGLLVLHELFFQKPIGISEFADAIQSESALFFPECKFLNYIDAAAFKEIQQISGPTVRIDKVLWEHGIKFCHPAPQRIEPRIETVKDWLNLMIRGQPAVLIDPGCSYLISGFRGGYFYGQVGNTPGRLLPDPVKNEFSHIMDALQYALAGVTRLQYQQENDDQDDELIFDPEAMMGRLNRFHSAPSRMPQAPYTGVQDMSNLRRQGNVGRYNTGRPSRYTGGVMD